MSSDPGNSLVEVALDPSRSVVVEACAGSGKTWLLASRIVRLLLAGVAPGEILAITFTRKAAREIEERVVSWLRLLAIGSESELKAFLLERGVAPDEATLRLARSLYERVLGAQPGLAVNTFHGWFLQLVDAAPLTANLGGATLVDADSRLFDELWQSFAAGLAGEVEESFVFLLRTLGLDATRRVMRRGVERRAEWLAFGEGCDDPLEYALAALRAELEVGEEGAALASFFEGRWQPDFHAYLGLLEMSELPTDLAFARTLDAALNPAKAPDECLEGLRGVFLTTTGSLRVRKPSKTADKRFGVEGAALLLELHVRLGERIADCLARQLEERIYAFNVHACRVLHAFLAHVEAFKAARRQIDFVDAEWRVLQLLRDEETAAFIQARLDARYRHVLLDEFQDTNPLQWQILLAWLDAYSDGVRPCIFLVGDPKQSIYRFRRAEPRLFAAAAEFLQTRFAAARLEQDLTRRNAQPIIDVVNALFLGVTEFQPFREQGSLAGSLPGRVELLPLFGEEDTAGEEGEALQPVATDSLRNPLLEPASEIIDERRSRDARRLAERIGEMVGVWQVEERNSTGQTVHRPLAYGDILLLTRSRGKLAEYEQALSAAGIPFDAASRGGLLDTLEARDLLALLEFLVTPVADLALAHCLRSPIFACSDEDLLALAQRQEACWWQRLLALARGGSASAHLQRAADLLGAWLQDADRLPAHDLLDRIYHQGEVPARYRLSVAPAAWPTVEANLRAVLLLSLDLDGGRYPSLPRFIDELRELRDADANDAPDEGAVEAVAADSGRVRILTIHGAKGLEAPVVWLLDAHAFPRADDAWDILVDWPPSAEAPRHFSFYGRKDERGRARQAMFEAEATAAAREELNLLYVAITRARQVFIASGIAGVRDSQVTPYRRLEQALGRLGQQGTHGSEMPQLPAIAGVAPGASLPPLAVDLPSIGQRRPASGAGERFGILLHALLERSTGAAAAEGWWRELGFSDGDYQQVLPVAERLLLAPHLRHFFDPALSRRSWNEVDVCTDEGGLRRIDRLVEFDDALWVLDYKSSYGNSERLPAYKAQVVDYCAAVRAVFPGLPVRGALIFADASLLEVG